MRSAGLATLLAAVGAAAGQAADGPPDSPAQFDLFARYSQAAYCQSLHDGFGRTAVCTSRRPGACRGLENTTSVKEFVNVHMYGVGGYMAINPRRKLLVLAFKGTDSMLDLITDMSKSQVPRRCRVHRGFGTAFGLVRDQVEAVVRAERRRPGQRGYRVVATGHSLGGAIVTLAAAHLRARGIPCDVYTYGSPRVGNAELAAFMAAQDGFTARVTSGRDVVAAIPKYGFGWLPPAYVHVFPEYWYVDGLSGRLGQYEARRRVCRSEGRCTSASCTSLWRILTWRGCNVRDHLRYAGPLKPCPAKGLGAPRSLAWVQTIVDELLR